MPLQAVTKAALNMMAVQLHNELHKDGFTVNPLHPGEYDHDEPDRSRPVS